MRTSKIVRFFWVAAMALVCGLNAASAGGGDRESGPEIRLSEVERAWVRENPVVDIASNSYFPPISFVAPGGRQGGMTLDLLKLLEQRTGLTFRLNMGPWGQNIAQAMNHEVDAVLNADSTKERRRRLLFTDVYFRIPQAIVVREGQTDIRTIDDLKGRRMALLHGTVHVDYFRRYYPDIEVRVANTPMQRFELLQSGAVDAVVGALPVLSEFLQSNFLSSFYIAGLYNSSQIDNLRIGVRNTAPELKSILDKAIATITPADRQAINEKWLPSTVVKRLDGRASAGVDLTAEERAWLEAHPIIRVAGDPAWAPVEFRGPDRQFYGMSVDYLRRISEMIGVRFEFSRNGTWSDAVEGLKQRRLDMFSAAMVTPSRRSYATFTEPYLSLAQVVFTHSNAPFIQDIGGLVGKRVAVVRNYAIAEIMAREHPWLEIVPVESVDEGIRAVSDGRMDAFIGGILNVGYRIREMGLSNIKVAGQTPYELKVSMAARSDWPILHRILEKALAALPARDVNQIQTAWIGARVGQPIDLGQFVMIGSIVAVGCLSIWIWVLMVQRARILESREDLRKAQEEAVEANRAKSRMLATMSHELRTPLNAIMGFSDVLRSRLFGPLGHEKYDQYAEDIHSSGELLLSLINDLLDIARIEAGKQEIHREWFDLGPLLQGTMKTFRRDAEEKGIAFAVDVPESLPSIHSDRRAIIQILNNLTGNAVKFTPPGGKITVGAETTDGKLCLVVADTGIGMSEILLNEVRRPFTRGETDPHRSQEGAGLGLSIVDGLVTALGGTMTIESAPGYGTTVRVHFPDCCLDRKGLSRDRAA